MCGMTVLTILNVSEGGGGCSNDSRNNSGGCGYFLGKVDKKSLDDIIEECARSKSSWGLVQNDIMFAVAFWSMVESGFQILEDRSKPPKTISDATALPKNWKHETRQLYQAHLHLPPYPDYPVKLVALPLDDILCINVFVSNVSSRNISLKSLAIHSSGYITRPEATEDRCQFSDFDNFILLLRNSIIWPIRCSILTDQGIMNASLCGLSDEIKLNVVKHLTVKEILMLSETCHDLYRICNDQGLWKTIFHDSFRDACKCSSEQDNECDPVSDWKETYKQAYLKKRKTTGSDGTEKESVESSPSESYHTAHERPYGSQIDLDID